MKGDDDSRVLLRKTCHRPASVTIRLSSANTPLTNHVFEQKRSVEPGLFGTTERIEQVRRASLQA